MAVASRAAIPLMAVAPMRRAVIMEDMATAARHMAEVGIMAGVVTMVRATMAAASVWASMPGPAIAMPRRSATPLASTTKTAIGIIIVVASRRPMVTNAGRSKGSRRLEPLSSIPFLFMGKWCVVPAKQKGIAMSTRIFCQISPLLALVACGARAEGTYSRDVAPILYRKCTACHHPNDIAPMSLMDYHSARPWAKAIREAVLLKRMPPWFADSSIGHFSNDPSLSEFEKQIITDWVDHGPKKEILAIHRQRLLCGWLAHRQARRNF